MSEQEGIEKLRTLIKDIQFCMLSTCTKDNMGNNYIHSRPMNAIMREDDFKRQRLYFFSGKDSWKNKEINTDHQVNLSFSDPSNHTYVSLSCNCKSEETNKELMRELWNQYCEIYFPKGLNDPNLTLLVCDIHHAEYWDVKQGSMMALVTSYIKASLGIKEPIAEEHERVSVRDTSIAQ